MKKTIASLGNLGSESLQDLYVFLTGDREFNGLPDPCGDRCIRRKILTIVKEDPEKLKEAEEFITDYFSELKETL